MQVVVLAKSGSLLTALATMLTARDHEPLSFSDPAEALAFLKQNDSASALLIVDQFGGMPGKEISWEARLLASPERPLYICLVSRPLKQEGFAEALDCGVDDVLQMPLSADELYARLRAAQRLVDLQLQLVESATRDELTGLHNRRAFFQRAERLLRSGATDISAAMVDIDHFKRVNDTYGHAAGDQAIRFVAGQLRDDTAIIGRLGGEEFAILSSNCTLQTNIQRMEILRERIACEDLDLEGARAKITCSFGVAALAPGENIDGLLRRADDALYVAKSTGRNRVVAYDSDMKIERDDSRSVVRGFGRAAAASEASVLNGLRPDLPPLAPPCVG